MPITTNLNLTRRTGSKTSSLPDTSQQVTWIDDQLSMFGPTTSGDTRSATSSPASVDGPTRSASPGGPTTDLSGPEAVPVSRFRGRDSGKAMPTNDTSGPLFTTSSPSARLQSSLESRLQARMGVNGSPEFVLIWKHWDMPAGLPICRLLSRRRDTIGSAFSWWPTPRSIGALAARITRDAIRRADGRFPNLETVIAWRMGDAAADCWVNPRFLCWLMLYPDSWEQSRPMATPSSRESRRSLSERTEK